MHDHVDGHGHSHHHAHDAQGASDERSTALLSYMVDHNRSHAAELHDLAHGLEGEAAALIHEAVELFDQGNDKLAEALRIMKGE
jgi:phytoene/squalene synthetase